MTATERELGPRQAALVDAVTTRLWSGLPMNENDLTATLWVASILDLRPEELVSDG